MKHIPFSKISINHQEANAIKTALRSGWLTSGPQCEQFEREFAAVANAPYAVSVNSATAGIAATLLALNCGTGDHLFVSSYTYTASVAPAISLGMTVHFIDIESDSFNIDTDHLASALSAHFKTLAKPHTTNHFNAPDKHRQPNRPTTATKHHLKSASQTATEPPPNSHSANHHPTPATEHQPPPTPTNHQSTPTATRTSKTIIMAVHIGGRICDMKTINQLADMYGCTVIEDAAHGQPLYGEGGAIDQRGHYTIFSFYPNKPICAAEGGMIVTDSAQQAQALRVVKNQGIDRAAWSRHQQISNPHANWWEYNVVTQGGKLNLSELHAAIGRVQLHKSHTFLTRRRQIAQQYHTLLCTHTDITLPIPTTHHSWHLYQILIDPKHNRDDIMHHLRAQHIETSVHYKPLTLMPYYQQHPLVAPTHTPLANQRWRHTISLPIYHGLKNPHLHRIVASLKHALQQ